MLYKSRRMQRACVRAGLVLALLSLLTSGVAADSSLHVKAGATTGQTDGLLTDRPGLALGGALSVTGWSPFPSLTLLPQLELLLARRNASLALDGTANLSYSMDFIELPLLLRTELTRGGRSFYALAGAYASVLLRAQQTNSGGIMDSTDSAGRVDIGFLAAGGFELVSSAWGELFVEARYQRGYRALLPGSDGKQEALSLLLGFGLGPDIPDVSDISDISDSSSPSQNQRLALTMKSGPLASRFRSPARSRAPKAATAMYSPGVWFGGAYSPARFGSWMALVPQLELAVVHRSGQDAGLSDGSLALDYIDLSLLMCGELPIGGGSIYGLGGLYGSILLRAQRTQSGVITDIRDTISAVDAGWIAGVGIERAATARTMVSLELRYQRGFHDLLPADPSEVTQQSVSCLFGITYGRAPSPASSPSLLATDSPLSETDGALDTIDTKLDRMITAMEASSSASHRAGTSGCRSRAATPANLGVFAMPIECAEEEAQKETRAALHTVLLALTRDVSTLIARLKQIARDGRFGEHGWIEHFASILGPTSTHAEWIVDELQAAQELLERADIRGHDAGTWQQAGRHYEAALLGAQVLSLWASWLDFGRALYLDSTLNIEWIFTRLWHAWREIEPVLVQLQSLHPPRFHNAAEAAVRKLPEWSNALYSWGKEAESQMHQAASELQTLLLIQAAFNLATTRQIVGAFASRTGAYVFMLPGIGGITASGAATGVRVVISAEWVAAMQHLIAIGAVTTVEIARIAGVSSMAMSAGKAPKIPSGTDGGPSPERQTASNTGAQAEGSPAPAAKPASGPAASGTTGTAPKGARPAFTHGHKYHPRVRARGVQDPKAHNFPYSFDDVILKQKPVTQADGSLLYRKPGTLNGKEGFFEIAVNPETNTIFHRTFVGGK